MKNNQMNRQSTRRISIPLTVCMTLLASCAAKPLEQDLSSGEATVEIKYLDGVTMDIIDDTRTKRRGFYEEALLNRKKDYSQGKQGAVDRVSTFAAAINANAQRDKSVLERYHAEGDRQFSALENSEELGDEMLEHNKKVISQTNKLNDAKVNALESQSETLTEINKAKVETVNVLSAEYQAEIGRISNDIDALKKEAAGYKEQLESATGAERISIQNKIDAIEGKVGQEGKIKGLEDVRSAAVEHLRTLLFGSTTAQGNAEIGLINGNSNSSTTAMSISPYAAKESFIDPMGIKWKWVKEPNQADENVGDWVRSEKYEFEPSQLPQAETPGKVSYLKDAAVSLEKAKDAIGSLANSHFNNAITGTRDLSAPPIERIRNDEAVFDYLIDGYRNTQVASGAEYGGMVRRVLPFSFTFTPGKNTSSGFSVRVILKPNQEEIKEAVGMIAPHFKEMNRSRGIGYAQLYTEAEKEFGNLTSKLLDGKYDGACNDVNLAFDDQDAFIKNFNDAFVGKEYKPAVPSDQQFWRAYSASMEALAIALGEDKIGKPGEISGARYTYDLTKVIASINDAIGKIKLESFPQSSGTLELENPGDYHDSKSSAAYASCVIDRKLKEKIGDDINKIESQDSNDALEAINQLVMAMTSAGLVREVYLQNNHHYTGENNVIQIVKTVGGTYEAIMKEFPSGNLTKQVEKAVKVRIVQNTSREHVVEIPDTAKINTLLSAGLTGNEISPQLGLTLGAEIAAAVSSSSAFIKRIPYAVPFSGQTFSFSGRDDTSQGQAFGWRFYKTPAGVTQFGSIAQSFKTTPVNSAVVVSMPEWMSKIDASYEISDDAGKTWKPVGGEEIIFSGVSLRSRSTDVKSKPFNTWVKYNIYKDDIDESVGLPVLKSCYAEKGKQNDSNGNKDGQLLGNNESKYHRIFGSTHGETAICGENLQGVKGILVGGRFIDEGIEKISSNLIKVKNMGLEPDDCPASTSCNYDDKCAVVLLSDFGASVSADGAYCLQYSYSDKDIETVDLQRLVDAQVETDKNNQKNISVKFDGHVTSGPGLKVTSYGIGQKKYHSLPHPDGNKEFTLVKDELVKKYCMKNKTEPCNIPIYGRVTIGTKELSGLLGKIDMDDLKAWGPYPENALMPRVSPDEVEEADGKYTFSIENVYWDFASPYSISVGSSKIVSVPPGGADVIKCEGNTEHSLICSADKANLRIWCSDYIENCPVHFKYKYDNELINIGNIAIPPAATGSN